METIKRALTFLTIILSASFAAVAQDTTATGKETAFVNFITVKDGQLYFGVKYLNEPGRRFEIKVNDSYGENLYQGSFSGKEFGKVFRAPAELGRLVVIIRTHGSKEQHKFEITSEPRFIREAYVTAVQ